MKCPAGHSNVFLYGADPGVGIHRGNWWKCYTCDPYGRAFRDDSPEALAKVGELQAESRANAQALFRKDGGQ